MTTPAAPQLDLKHRPRRNRKSQWARRLVSETRLDVSDLIWPIFIVEGEKRREEIASMPGVYRYSIDLACEAVIEAASLGIPAVALFPNIDPELRDLTASNATLPDNLVCRATRAIKSAAPNIGVITDVALDPYTSHGHDGLLMEEEIINDATVALLARQAINQAQAGCDIIAPSDMMDGRIGAIRSALDAEGFQNVQIMSYAAKYASAFYGPFREAIGTSRTLRGDKRTYQMDPANVKEALREVALDLEEKRKRDEALQQIIDAQVALNEEKDADENQQKINDIKSSIRESLIEDENGDVLVNGQNPMNAVLNKK